MATLTNQSSQCQAVHAAAGSHCAPVVVTRLCSSCCICSIHFHPNNQFSDCMHACFQMQVCAPPSCEHKNCCTPRAGWPPFLLSTPILLISWATVVLTPCTWHMQFVQCIPPESSITSGPTQLLVHGVCTWLRPSLQLWIPLLVSCRPPQIQVHATKCAETSDWGGRLHGLVPLGFPQVALVAVGCSVAAGCHCSPFLWVGLRCRGDSCSKCWVMCWSAHAPQCRSIIPIPRLPTPGVLPCLALFSHLMHSDILCHLVHLHFFVGLPHTIPLFLLFCYLCILFLAIDFLWVGTHCRLLLELVFLCFAVTITAVQLAYVAAKTSKYTRVPSGISSPRRSCYNELNIPQSSSLQVEAIRSIFYV